MRHFYLIALFLVTTVAFGAISQTFQSDVIFNGKATINKEFLSGGVADSSTGDVTALSTSGYYRIRLTGAAPVLRGIGGGTDGKELIAMNATGDLFQIENEDTMASAANRILTGTGASLAFPADAAIKFVYDGAVSRWRIAGGGGSPGTPFTTVAPLAYDSGTQLLSISQASGGGNGYLSSTDWNTFNSKQNALSNFTDKRVLFGDGTNSPATSGELLFNTASKYFSVGTVGSSGARIGVGITAPSSPLDIRSTADASTSEIIARFGRPDGTVYTTIENGVTGGDGTTIGPITAHPLVFQTSDTERMRVTSTGIVGVGTSSPVTSEGRGLHVYNNTNDGTVNSNATVITQSEYRNAFFQIVAPSTRSVGINFRNTSPSNQTDQSTLVYNHNTKVLSATVNSGSESASYDLSSTIADPTAINLSSSSPVSVISMHGGTSSTSDLNLDSATILLHKLRAGTDAMGMIGVRNADTSSGSNSLLQLWVRNGSAMTSALTATSAGSVGIGTTSPGSALDVKGAVRISGATSGYFGLQVPSSASSTTYTLPSADGANGSALTTNGAGTLSFSNAVLTSGGGTGQVSYTNGQLLIGNTTGSTLTKATLTSGMGISVVNGPGSITLSQAVVAPVAISASDIDWSLVPSGGVLYKTLAADTTFTMSNVTAGKTVIVDLTNTASNYVVTWPTTVSGIPVTWSGGTPPVQTVGAKSDTYTFVRVNGAIRASVVQNF